MKIFTVITIILLSGCAAYPSMEELETQAMLTGDWSQVERRERAMERRQLRDGIQCPISQIGYCEDRGYEKLCTCIERDTFHSVMSWR